MQKNSLTGWSAISIVVMFATFASTSAGGEELPVFGTLSCGEWVQRAGYPTGKITNEYWLAGFMSGQAVASKKNVLKDTDIASMTLWIDQYCKNDPLSNTVTAGKNLFLELLKRKTTTP